MLPFLDNKSVCSIEPHLAILSIENKGRIVDTLERLQAS